MLRPFVGVAQEINSVEVQFSKHSHKLSSREGCAGLAAGQLPCQALMFRTQHIRAQRPSLTLFRPYSAIKQASIFVLANKNSCCVRSCVSTRSRRGCQRLKPRVRRIAL